MKYAIKIPFEDNFLYLTEGSLDDLQVVLYNTREEAERESSTWGTSVEIVEYKELGDD